MSLTNTYHSDGEMIVINSTDIGSIEIHIIQSSNKQMISINVDPSDTIKHLKTEITKQNKVPINIQVLKFDDQILQNDKTASHYNITNQCLLMLTINQFDKQQYVIILAHEYTQIKTMDASDIKQICYPEC